MIRLIHLALITLALVAYLPPWVNPSFIWPISTLGLLAPTLWLATLLFAAYWLLKKDRRAWLSGITLLLGWSMINSAFALPDGGPAPTGEDLQIVSLNGHGFRIYGFSDEQAIQTAIVAYLDSLEADVLCIQEFYTDPKGKALAARIQANTPLKYSFRDPAGRLAVFSRFPLKNGEVTYFENRVNGYLQVDVDSPKGVFHLCNVHLQTNAISQMAHSVAKDPDIREKNIRKTIRTMFARYGRSNKTRTEQSRQILKELSIIKQPTIVCGDFNEVPTSYLYRLFRENFQDAHLRQSWGLGTTYSGLLPGLRIDYVLPDYSLQVLDFERLPCWFSDHKGVKAVIRQ